MYNKIKKVIILVMVIALSFQSIKSNIFANESNGDQSLNPGEVTQNKSAKWVDYGKGIAEISFDVVGKNAEEPLDVAIVYDNSGSMQTFPRSASFEESPYLFSRWYYASTAAKMLANNLLDSADNNVAFIPFSDVLMDGESTHTNPTDFFETHDLILDKQGNPHIEAMRAINSWDSDVKANKITMEEFYSNCANILQMSVEEVKNTVLKEADNTKNSLVPFTNNKEEIETAINNLYPSHAGETNYEVALLKAQEYFKSSNNKSSNNKKVLLMISDGKPNKGGDSTVVANALKNSGVTIYTIGTDVNDADAATLKAIASKENGVPLYTPSTSSDLDNVLKILRQQFEIAASDGVIEDAINTDYFEYYTDATHFPTVNGVALGSENFIVSPDKSNVTWKIGDIRETTKTLRFYVKVKKLSEDLLKKDNSLLNEKGTYTTNGAANLSYKEVNTGKVVDEGHGMVSPSLEVLTASMKVSYYVSDAEGNFILDNGNKITLKQTESDKKALHVEYGITPEKSIVVNGKTYFIYKEDNKTENKIFTENDLNRTFELGFRYVEQLHVTFDSNGFGTLGNEATEQTLPVDHTTMTIPKLPEVQNIPNDKVFMGWNTEKDGKGIIFTSATEVKNNTTVVYAQWKDKDKYLVTFKDGNRVFGKDEVFAGENATAPTSPTKEGYSFIKWDKGFENIQADLEVNAIFQANNYTVKFDGNGQTDGTMENQAFVYDKAQSLTKNTFTKENHTFMGWLYNGNVYTDEQEVKNLISTSDGEVTLVAQWKENNQYNVIFQDEDGKELKKETVYEGNDATAPNAPTKEGYSFDGWDKEYTNVTSNLTVKAKFQANKYTVKFDGNGQADGTMENQAFVYDKAQSLTKNTFTKENHTFMGWLYNGNVYTDEQEVKNLISTSDGEVTLVAQWKENNQYNVIFQDEDGKELKKETVYEGNDATAPNAPTRDGYTFIGWDKEYTNVTADLIVTALWEAVVTDTPDTPETPDIPETPDTPDTPVIPNTPTLPATPLTPTVPIQPIVRNIPNVTPVQPLQPNVPNQEVPLQPEVEVPNKETPKVNVKEKETPLAKGDSSWALINLLSSILTILLVIVILLGKRTKEEEDEEEKNITYKRRKWTMFMSVIVALGSVIAFILTENIFLPMILIDDWTLLMLAILLVQVIVLVLAKKWKKNEQEESTVQA